jgi:hypothetical protein
VPDFTFELTQPEALQVDLAQPQQLLVTLAVGQGPAGAPGGTNDPFEQLVAAAEWIVNHNLGRRPAVTLLSTGGVEMVAEVLHVSLNQFRVYFDQPRAGLAIYT